MVDAIWLLILAVYRRCCKVSFSVNATLLCSLDLFYQFQLLGVHDSLFSILNLVAINFVSSSILFYSFCRRAIILFPVLRGCFFRGLCCDVSFFFIPLPFINLFLLCWIPLSVSLEDTRTPLPTQVA